VALGALINCVEASIADFVDLYAPPFVRMSYDLCQPYCHDRQCWPRGRRPGPQDQDEQCADADVVVAKLTAAKKAGPHQRTRRNRGARFAGRSGCQRLCRPDQNERHNADRGEEQQF
jgi:hypothetical protein